MASFKPTVIIDNGSYSCKAGFVGNRIPEVVVETIYGEEKIPNVTGFSNENNVGGMARKNPVLKIKYPIRRGLIKTWSEIEKIWEFILIKKLNIDPSDHPIFVCDSPINQKTTREKMVQLLFEQFKSPMLCLRNQAPLVIRTANVNTGIVLDCGHEITCATSVYEGCAMSHATNYLDFAGRDLNDYLIKIMDQHDHSFLPSEQDCIREIKEKCCRIRSKTEGTTGSKTEYKSSDYKIYNLNEETITSPEILFDLSVIDRNENIQRSLYSSIMKCDENIQEDLFNNIVVCGGTTNLKGFNERLREELVPFRTSQIRIHDGADIEHEFLSFNGASTSCTSNPEDQLWISRQEYDDTGPSIINKKYS